jgi:hypothetical protein
MKVTTILFSHKLRDSTVWCAHCCTLKPWNLFFLIKKDVCVLQTKTVGDNDKKRWQEMTSISNLVLMKPIIFLKLIQILKWFSQAFHLILYGRLPTWLNVLIHINCVKFNSMSWVVLKCYRDTRMKMPQWAHSEPSVPALWDSGDHVLYFLWLIFFCNVKMNFNLCG